MIRTRTKLLSIQRKLAYALVLAGVISAAILLLFRNKEKEQPQQDVVFPVDMVKVTETQIIREPEAPVTGVDREIDSDAKAVEGSEHYQDLFISGTAFAGTLKNPLAGEKICFRIKRGARTFLRPVTTGSKGTFRVGGLGPGEYDLSLEHPDFHPVSLTVSLSPEQSSSGLEILFERGMKAWGIVRDLQELSAPDVILEWIPKGGKEKAAEVITDASGSYEIGGLEPGPYLVRVVPRLLRTVWKDSPTRQVTLREGVSNRFDFTAEVGASIEVMVMGENETALPSLQVRFVLATDRRGITGFLPFTGKDGRTLLRGLPRKGKLMLEVPDGKWNTSRAELDLANLPDMVSLISKAVQGG